MRELKSIGTPFVAPNAKIEVRAYILDPGEVLPSNEGLTKPEFENLYTKAAQPRQEESEPTN